MMKVGDLIAKCGKLKGNWSTRDRKIKERYDILLLKDELKQEGMESVVSNDPRTGYNLAKHLMTSSTVAHKINIEQLTGEQVSSTSYLENFVTQRWLEEERRYRRIGRQSFKGELAGLMLATGWLSVFSMVEDSKIWSEVWNPIEVYPEFGREGLIEVVHIYAMSPAAANRKIKLMGWEVKQPFSHKVALYDYWGFDDDGDVVNGIIIGQDYVKELVKDTNLSNLTQKHGEPILPVFISPVGGLPDIGSISSTWQEHFGESITATNEDLVKNYNKMLSFAQQATRSAAQHRWYEKSSGDIPILKEENMDKWGAIFRMGPNDDVGAIVPPAIPIELRTIMFEYSNMLQRGLFPAAIFGNIQMQMSYLAMANIASAALQVLTPYMDSLRGFYSDIDNYWINMIVDNELRPNGFKKPDTLPKEFDFDVQADIEIPGYLVQRATVARMLDPNFMLSTTTTMDKLFPEIRNPLSEQARSRRDIAMSHPKAILVDQIIAYREQAAILRKDNNVGTAELYEKLADSLESELSPQVTQPPPTRTRGEVSVPREVMPEEFAEPTQGMGQI